jgi:hypothetical protein
VGGNTHAFHIMGETYKVTVNFWDYDTGGQKLATMQYPTREAALTLGRRVNHAYRIISNTDCLSTNQEKFIDLLMQEFGYSIDDGFFTTLARVFKVISEELEVE